MTGDAPEAAIRDVEENPQDVPISVKQLFVQTLRILIPTDVSSLLWMSSQTITMYYVGKYLGGVGTAQYSASIIVFNMCAFSIIMGFGAAIDTLSSQAYGANPKSPEVGETLQMALALNFLLAIIFSMCFYYSEPVVCYIFDADVCVGAAQFLRYSPLYLFGQVVSGVMSKTMYAQNLSEVVAVANAVAALTSPLANYFLTPLGIHGAALALGVTVGFCSLAHIACAIFHPKAIIRYAPWPSPKLSNVEAWKTFFRIGFPALVATCAEWWAFEIQTVLAARISTDALAIHGVAMNMVGLLFSVSLGMSVAASVIVGNSLGAGRPHQAKQFAHFVMVCDVGLGLLTASAMLLFGTHIAHFYGKDENIINGVTRIIPLVALTHVGDSAQFCLQGIFRGAGRPAQAGLAVLLTLWCIGLPASAFFVFVMKVGVYGCLGGIVAGMACEVPLLIYWMLKFDWSQLATEARAGEAASPRPATEVVVTTPCEDDDKSFSEPMHSCSSSVSSHRSGGRHCIHATVVGVYERELHERTPSILEDACCSLHNSFSMPPRT